MDWGTIIGDTLLAMSTVTVGLVTRKHVKAVAKTVEDTNEKVDLAARSRIPDRRIRQAVREVAQTMPDLFTEAVLGEIARNLIAAIVDDNDV